MLNKKKSKKLSANFERLNCLVRGRRKSGRVEEEEEDAAPVSAPPRENKENEVHLSISLEEPAPCELSQEDLTSEELYITPSSSGEQCLETNKCKGPKKNYEKLAPFKFFCNICSFKTKRESHYQRHLERHETVSSCPLHKFVMLNIVLLTLSSKSHSFCERFDFLFLKLI